MSGEDNMSGEGNVEYSRPKDFAAAVSPLTANNTQNQLQPQHLSGQGAIVNCSPNISGPEIGNTQGNQGNQDKKLNNYGDQFNNQGEQFNIKGNRGRQNNIGKKTSHTNNYGGQHGDHGTLKSGGSFNFGSGKGK